MRLPLRAWSGGSLLVGAALALSGGATLAQDTLPPHQGGSVRSLGLPPRLHSHAALTLSMDRVSGDYLGAQARVGMLRPVGSPVFQMLSVGGEVYGGVRDTRTTAGVRPMVVSPFLGVGAGVDLDLRTTSADPFLMVVSPMRRGGFVGHGSSLRLEWHPTRKHSFGLTAVQPLGGHYGRTRPLEDRVRLRAPSPRAIAFVPDDDMARALADLFDSSVWLNQSALVPMGRPGQADQGDLRAAVAPLRARLAGRSADDEIRHYHHQLEHAFSLAAATGPLTAGEVTPLGAQVAAVARRCLLDGVLFPYNRLIGQRKHRDTTLEFAMHARGAFARWLIQSSAVEADRVEATIFVFQALLDLTERVRSTNSATWGDSRLVWLPLQLALRPEDYVRQEDMDTLISDAVGRRIQHGNRIWYVYNDRFLLNLVESIGEAHDYHILWVHDFRGLADRRRPDRLSLLAVTQAYFSALTRRVEAYDSVGALPVFMVFLDQHYFETYSSRDLLALLQNPLHHRLRLPALTPGLADTIASWQEDLRHAVDASRLLTAERAEYGEGWLRRLVKVHVSVTNPVDPSFRSTHVLGFMGAPDDVMRDHRKAVVYDVTEADPYRGMAMYAGMGVGEWYASSAWEDRAIMIQGPAALSMRDAARRLLEQQGIRDGSIPHVLRPQPRPLHYEERVRTEVDSMDAWGGVATRAVELHNTTGFGPKEIAVAQATLFNLASPGAVFKVPDSVWLNELLASLLAGAALRGTRVLAIAPSAASAPAHPLGLPGIHLLSSKLVALGRELDPEITRAGGMLRLGLYNAPAQVHDLEYRMRSLQQSLERHAFLRELYPALHRTFQEMAAAGMQFPGNGPTESGDGGLTGLAAAGSDGARAPPQDPDVFARLHFKGFLYVSQEAWSRLLGGEALATALQVYLEERSRQLRDGAGAPEGLMAQALHVVGAELINPILEEVDQDERDRWAFYFQLGSPNLDYRSMLLDGEVAILVSGWTSLYGALDFLLLTGLVTWVGDQAEIDALLPPPTRPRRILARWVRMIL
jgi:phosphatidylserine/phosphatidylglycerophosphate/cardiolipin synthase-like enzyme